MRNGPPGNTRLIENREDVSRLSAVPDSRATCISRSELLFLGRLQVSIRVPRSARADVSSPVRVRANPDPDSSVGQCRARSRASASWRSASSLTPRVSRRRHHVRQPPNSFRRRAATFGPSTRRRLSRRSRSRRFTWRSSRQDFDTEASVRHACAFDPPLAPASTQETNTAPLLPYIPATSRTAHSWKDEANERGR